jgi:hypothetical protein
MTSSLNFYSYWGEFIQSEWYFRYQVDLLTSRSVTLGDIMYHDTALSYFMQVSNGHETALCHFIITFQVLRTLRRFLVFGDGGMFKFNRVLVGSHKFQAVCRKLCQK